jgi:hypothetical protein
MACGRIFPARIAKTDDEFHWIRPESTKRKAREVRMTPTG